MPYMHFVHLYHSCSDFASLIFSSCIKHLQLKAMIKEVKTQASVGVGLDILWKVLAKDLKAILPKIIPNLVKDADMIEGDGGIGTVYLFRFGPGQSFSSLVHLLIKWFKLSFFFFFSFLMSFLNERRYIMLKGF